MSAAASLNSTLRRPTGFCPCASQNVFYCGNGSSSSPARPGLPKSSIVIQSLHQQRRRNDGHPVFLRRPRPPTVFDQSHSRLLEVQELAGRIPSSKPSLCSLEYSLTLTVVSSAYAGRQAGRHRHRKEERQQEKDRKGGRQTEIF